LTLVIDPNLLLLKKKNLWVMGSWLHDPFMRQYIQHGEALKLFRYEYSEVVHHLFGSIVTQVLSKCCSRLPPANVCLNRQQKKFLHLAAYVAIHYG
jgi:hypothetical protein